MQSHNHAAPVSKKMIWAGRIVSALPVLLLLMDGVMKLIKPAGVMRAHRNSRASKAGRLPSAFQPASRFPSHS
jgi:hypothetical protein